VIEEGGAFLFSVLFVAITFFIPEWSQQQADTVNWFKQIAGLTLTAFVGLLGGKHAPPGG